jgi:hypothetical protein
MTVKDVPPSVWQRRRLRIAAENAERARRKAERQRPALIEEEEVEEEQPARRKGKKRNSAVRSGKASAIVTRDRLKKQRGLIERSMAWLVLLLSFLGTIAALHGGFVPFAATLSSGRLNTTALLGGILIQLVITFLEWWYFDRPSIAWGARLVDTGITAVGYGPLLITPLMLLLYNQGVADPQLLAWGLIILFSLGIAWFPESRLVD